MKGLLYSKMNITLFNIVVAAALATASVNAEPPRPSSPLEQLQPGSVLIVAHRACWSAAPENSVAALNRCRALGVDAAEIDAQLTRDGQVVVFHDQRLDRMTNGTGPLSEYTFEELQKLNLKESDSTGSDIVGRPFLTRHKIPLLADMLRAAGDDILINLEIKANDRWTFEETFQAAARIADETGTDHQIFWKIPPPQRGGGTRDVPADDFFDRLPTANRSAHSPIIWRSERPFLTQMEDYSDHRITVFELVSDDTDYWPLSADGTVVGSDRTLYMGVTILPDWGGVLSDELALRDPDAAWGKMIDLGFRLIMTDRPEQLADYLHQRGLR